MGDVVPISSPGGKLSPPGPIRDGLQINHFDCGEPSLNDWLKDMALKSEGRTARTFVVTNETTVVGFYCLSTGGILRNEAPKKLARNSPPSIPLMVLGRLGVDLAYQGRGIGSGLLRDAMRRTLMVSQSVGVRALLVHALHDKAIAYYRPYGFIQFPEGTQTLFLPIETIAKAL